MICFAGIPLITAYNIISSIFRGLGDSKSPMYFIAVACFFNIILDYIFIGIFHLGASGAALGTTLAQTISVVIALLAILKKNTGISVHKEDLKPQARTLKNILQIEFLFPSGWIYPNILYYHNDHCKPKRFK